MLNAQPILRQMMECVPARKPTHTRSTKPCTLRHSTLTDLTYTNKLNRHTLNPTNAKLSPTLLLLLLLLT